MFFGFYMTFPTFNGLRNKKILRDALFFYYCALVLQKDQYKE